MAGKQTAKQNERNPEKETAPHDYRANPEVQERHRSYAKFLARHPLVQALRAKDKENIEKLLDELGI